VRRRIRWRTSNVSQKCAGTVNSDEPGADESPFAGLSAREHPPYG